MSKVAIESLIEKRNKIIEEKQKAIERFDAKITEIDEAIEIISGKKLKDVLSKVPYDDENSDYITGTEDGI